MSDVIRMIGDLPDLKQIPNGEKVRGTFSDAEMQGRLARLRAVMAERGIDAALFTSIHNVNYYSDFLYCSFGRPYGLVVTGERSTSISANIDAGQPWRRTFGENVVFTDWRRDNFVRAVQSLVPAAGRLGEAFEHHADGGGPVEEYGGSLDGSDSHMPSLWSTTTPTPRRAPDLSNRVSTWSGRTPGLGHRRP